MSLTLGISIPKTSQGKKATLLCAVVSIVVIQCSDAADFGFYKSFSTRVTTNRIQLKPIHDPVLVDTNNTSPKLTNTLSLEQIREQGQAGPLRLGMSMDEVVALLGKPKALHPNCDGGHRLAFADCSLVFTGNSLTKIRFGNGAIFNHGLSATANLGEWTQALGTPTIENGVCKVYEKNGNPRTVLLLTFEKDGAALFAPALYLDPPLTNWFKKEEQ